MSWNHCCTAEINTALWATTLQLKKLERCLWQRAKKGILETDWDSYEGPRRGDGGVGQGGGSAHGDLCPIFANWFWDGTVIIEKDLKPV